MNTPEEIDTATQLINDVLEEADKKAIPRRRIKSLLKKLPPELRHLVRVKRNLVKRASAVIDNDEKSDLLNEVKTIENMINSKTDNIIREEWRKACDNLNAITGLPYDSSKVLFIEIMIHQKIILQFSSKNTNHRKIRFSNH